MWQINIGLHLLKTIMFANKAKCQCWLLLMVTRQLNESERTKTSDRQTILPVSADTAEWKPSTANMWNSHPWSEVLRPFFSHTVLLFFWEVEKWKYYAVMVFCTGFRSTRMKNYWRSLSIIHPALSSLAWRSETGIGWIVLMAAG